MEHSGLRKHCVEKSMKMFILMALNQKSKIIIIINSSNIYVRTDRWRSPFKKSSYTDTQTLFMCLNVKG